MSLEKIVKSGRKKLGILTLSALMTLTSCGKDGNPTTPTENLPNVHLEHQQEITNQSGFSTFNDDGSRVEITVKDQNNNPIPNATINYVNGENNSYDIFIVSAPNHLPTIKSFDHNSKSLSHIINLISTEVSNFTLNTIFGTSDKQALLNFMENYVPQASVNTGAGILYNGTKTTRELTNTYTIGLNVGLFALSQGTSSPILKILSTASGFTPTQELLEDLIGPENTWDNYKPLWLNTQLGINISSNRPRLNLNTPILNGPQLIINATSQDSESYFGFIPDPTNRILGPTQSFDPTYTRKIIKVHPNGQEELISIVQNIPNSPPWTIPFNHGEGNYKLELIVTDDTRINTTQDQKNFTATSDPGTITLTPTDDTFIHRHTRSDGAEEFLDEVNGEREDLFVHHHYVGAGVSSWTERHPLLKFNIPQSILNSNITNAELQLYGDFMTGSLSDFRIYIHKLNSDWTEESATWRNAHGKIGEQLFYIPLDILDYDFQNPNKLFKINLTPYIQNIPHGIAITSTVSGLNLHSKEYPGEQYDPKLVIDYTPNNQ